LRKIAAPTAMLIKLDLEGHIGGLEISMSDSCAISSIGCRRGASILR
jgi:hypothetical protein